MASNYNHVAAPAGRGGARRRSAGSSSGARPRTTCSPWTSDEPSDPAPAPLQGRPARLRRRRHRGRPRCCDEHGRRPRRPRRRPARARRHRRAPAARTRDLPVDPALFTADAAALVTRDDVDLVVEVIGGIEPARTLAARGAAAAARASSPPTRRCSPQDGATLYEAADARRGRPLLRGQRRRRHPAAAAAARVARRRPRSAACSASSTARPTTSSPAWTRPGRASPRRSTRPPRSATPRPTRPPTSRASTPRPRPRSSRALAFHTRVTAADVHREGITDGDGRRRRERQGDGLRRQAAGDRRAGADETAISRARAPGDDPADAPAGVGARGLQRGVRRGRRRRPADVLRPRRRRRRRPPARCSATWSRSRATGSPAAAARASRRTRTCRLRPMGETVTRYHVEPRRRRQGGCARRGRPGVRRARRVSISDACARRATATTRRWCSSRTRRPMLRLPRTVEELRDLDVVRAVASVMRVEGRDEHEHSLAQQARLARRDRGVPRPAAGARRRRRSSRCSRAARRWSRRRTSPSATGCEVYLKVEGANPTGLVQGPRHDDGHQQGASRRAARRSSAPRTGNTSASAAAYAARAGLTCAVLVPSGKIALGKLAQALVHGARLLQVDGNFDDCLTCAATCRGLPGHAGQLGQPGPHRGPEDRGLRDRATRSATPPTCTACRSATPATSPPTGRATASTPRTAPPRSAA